MFESEMACGLTGEYRKPSCTMLRQVKHEPEQGGLCAGGEDTPKFNHLITGWHFFRCVLADGMAQLDEAIWTIGHSTRSIEEFTRMLQSFKIEQLVDVRHFPGSRKYPHFNKLPLSQSLAEAGIQYEHLESLGGRRKAKEHSNNTAWRHPAFRGYADYMETADFKVGINRLEEIARKHRTAFMCSEAVWWRCHRSLISDLLKVKGWLVLHIMDVDKISEHPFTSAAKIANGELNYSS